MIFGHTKSLNVIFSKLICQIVEFVGIVPFRASIIINCDQLSKLLLFARHSYCCHFYTWFVQFCFIFELKKKIGPYTQLNDCEHLLLDMCNFVLKIYNIPMLCRPGIAQNQLTYCTSNVYGNTFQSSIKLIHEQPPPQQQIQQVDCHVFELLLSRWYVCGSFFPSKKPDALYIS